VFSLFYFALWIFLEFLQALIYVLFSFTDHSYYYHFLKSLSEFIHFTVANVHYCEVVEFWSGLVALLFHLSFVSSLGFVRSHLLEVLKICSLSVEIFLLFKPGWGAISHKRYNLVANHSSMCSGPQHCSDWGKLAGVSCRSFNCLVLGCFHYRNFLSLCTRRCCSLQGTYRLWAGQVCTCDTTPLFPSLCLQGQEATKSSNDA
jgi:hypothetical protein